ncbi:sulfurtransferase [Porticoccus sp.]
MMTSPLMTPAQLQQLDPTKRIIFDCRFSLADFALGQQQYQQGHIPGAFHLDMEKDLSGPKGQHGGRHPLPTPEQFSATLRGCGVNADTLVVAYDDNRMAGAARLWWLLRYFGHDNVRVLDGGIKGWLACGGELSTTVPTSESGRFLAKANPHLTVTMAHLQQGLENSTLIDAREAPRYRGEQEPIDPVAGHIPSALNLPWLQVTNSEGCFVSAEVQRQQWQSLGALSNPVVYCGSGVTACVDLLSLTMIGVDNARLYSGSWSDWCSYPENSIATGDTP